MRKRSRFRVVSAIVAVCALAAACGATSAKPASKPKPKPLLYVSLGDSYAAGYQPTGLHSGHTDTNGFAYQIPKLAAAKGWDFKLVNFGCGGATTSSILHSDGCDQLGPGAPTYPGESQAAAAEAFLRAHKGQVGLVTVSIGGNDVTACVAAASPTDCVIAAVKGIATNLATLLKGLRAAAGSSVRIVGTTYPDVILGLYVSHTASLRSLATLSVTAFREFINPTLKTTYKTYKASFVDVTAATGAYQSFKDTTTLAPYGKIPVAVAKVCELTYFCQYQDIHPHTAGYTIIAKLVVGTLPEHH
ncbi:MAG: SGNH/GDSL hydrolase family protein [Acidimicrobiales bacterium]